MGRNEKEKRGRRIHIVHVPADVCASVCSRQAKFAVDRQ